MNLLLPLVFRQTWEKKAIANLSIIPDSSTNCPEIIQSPMVDLASGRTVLRGTETPASIPFDCRSKTLLLTASRCPSVARFNVTSNVLLIIATKNASLGTTTKRLALIGALCTMFTHCAAATDGRVDIGPRLTHARDAAAAPPAGTTGKLPTVHVQISTPPEYLNGNRDDFEQVSQGSIYSEYGFAFSGSSLSNIRVSGTENTIQGAKPFRESQGIQLNVSHRLFGADSRLPNPATLDVLYGTRYLKFKSWPDFYRESRVIGNLSLNTRLMNEYFGPQFALQWAKQVHGLKFNVSSALMVGYDLTKATQTSSLEQPWYRFDSGVIATPGLAPGRLNRPIVTEPASTQYDENVSDFATVAEVRAITSYPLSKHAAFSVGYIGTYFSHFTNADAVNNYTLPEFGLSLDTAASDIWVDQFHASIEWRR